MVYTKTTCAHIGIVGQERQDGLQEGDRTLDSPHFAEFFICFAALLALGVAIAPHEPRQDVQRPLLRLPPLV